MPIKLIALLFTISLPLFSHPCEKKGLKNIVPLVKVVVDGASDSDSSSSIVGASTSSSSASCPEHIYAIQGNFEYIHADLTQKILMIDMAEYPRQAGRLSTVCKAWNAIVNDEKTILTVINYNPVFYANNLMCAGCKKLNSKKLPPSCIEKSESKYDFSADFSSSSSDSEASDDGLGDYYRRAQALAHKREKEKEKLQGCACMTSIIVGPLVGGGIGIIGVVTTNSGWFF